MPVVPEGRKGSEPKDTPTMSQLHYGAFNDVEGDEPIVIIINGGKI